VSVPFRVRDVLEWTGGALVRGDGARLLRGASIDSRRVAADDLFVAIRGPQHDAHRFLDQAVGAGAAALLVCRDATADLAALGDAAVVAVDDTTRALGEVAAGHRRAFTGPVVAVTGSNGKTTTKEMCAAILSVSAPCLRNEGNLNNEFGLPLTLLRRERDHASAVVELGMNHRGEIARLAAIARPTVGLVTNVGTAHIEFLGSREEIAREKGDLYAALPADGVAVVNRDDALAAAQAGRAPCRALGFGLRAPAEVRAEQVRFVEGGAFRFELATPEGACPVQVAGLAETAVANALAAAACALAAGARLDDVRAGLAAYRAAPGRMAPVALPSGATLIDDTYNANPQSLRAALEALARLKGGGRAIAVVGDMGELGAQAESAHREAGRLAAELGVDLLFALGERAELVVAGAREGGMEAEQARAEKHPDELAQAVKRAIEPGDWVLVKGSRAMKMEKVVEAIASEEAA
jgi:UDP-N-acetylmuramoyl-tripeptide--D-alanyl-D-alanine ligase